MKEKQIVTSGFLPAPTSIETLSGKAGNSKLKALYRLLLLPAVLGSLWVTGVHKNFCYHDKGNSLGNFSNTAPCAQVDSLQPLKHDELWKNLSAIIGSSEFQSKAVNWLGNAVRIPWVQRRSVNKFERSRAFRTESWDSMDPVGVDPRWEVFEPFQAHLLGDFPLVCVYSQ